MKTLKIACEEFVAHLRKTGTASITANNYARILGLFVDFHGPEKDILKITPAHVAKFYLSEPATMKTLQDGSKAPRADLSYLQIKRDVRLALCWFKEMGWIDKVPLPPEERRFLEPKTRKKKPEQEMNTGKSVASKASKKVSKGKDHPGQVDTLKAASGEMVPVIESDTECVPSVKPLDGGLRISEPGTPEPTILLNAVVNIDEDVRDGGVPEIL